MRRICTRGFAAAAAFLGLVALAHPASAVELILGTNATGGDYFRMGSGMSRSVTRSLDDIVLFTQITKGSVENMQRLARKRRGIQLGLASMDMLKDAWNAAGKFAETAKGGTAKPIRDVAALMVVSGGTGGPHVLVGRKDLPEDTVYRLVRFLVSDEGRAMMTKAYAAWAPQSGAAAFAGAGIPVHPGAARALKEMGVM